MKLFPHGHATHPQWQMAAGLVLAQVRAQMALPEYASSPTLALLYITDHYASSAQDILEHLSAELPEITDWSGTVGVGVVANQVEYLDEPALVLMLCELPPDQYRVFSGVAPLGLGFEAHSALIHADGGTHDLPELLQEMAERTASGYLFGGLSSSRSASVQFAVGGNGNISGQGAASGVFSGGLSGVAFGEGVNLVSRVTQGCQPVSKARKVTQAEGNVVITLDGEPALDVLLDDLGVTLDNVNLIRVGDDMLEGTRMLAPRTLLVQLKDHPVEPDPRREGGARSVALGEGVAPLDELIAILAAAGYDGAVCVELASLGGEDVDELAMIERSVGWLRSHLP